MKIIYYPSLRVRFYCQDKNASTSLFAYFEELSGGEQLIHWDYSTPHFNSSFNLSRDEVCRPRVALEFTVVRNSWERIESLYRMLAEQHAGREDGIPARTLHPWFASHQQAIVNAIESPKPFLHFVRLISGLSQSECDSHWQPQTAGLPLGHQNFRVLRLNRLESDFKVFVRPHLPRATIPRIKVLNSRRSVSAPIVQTAETIKEIGQYYAHEISLFGFAPPQWHNDYKFTRLTAEYQSLTNW